MLDTSALNRVLGALYRAPTQPEMWDVFISELGAMSGVTKGALIAHHFGTNDHRMLATLGEGVKAQENVRLYENVYCQFDEWTVRFPKRGVNGRIVRGERRSGPSNIC